MESKTAQKETVAAIDVGSNSIRLLVAEAARGKVRELDRLVAPVMIGRDTFSSGRISNAVARETSEVLKGFARVMKEYGVSRYSAVATSAVREAFNRDTFLDTVETASGLDIKVIEPIEETRLLHQVVREAMEGTFDRPGKTVLVLALGSGSAEISAFREGRLILTETGRIGTLRLMETLASDASEKLLYQRLSTFVINVASTLERVYSIPGVDTLVVVNSELHELLERNRFRGVAREGKVTRVARAPFEKLAARVADTPVSERPRRFGVGYDSAETLTAAIVVVRAFIETTSARSVVLPDVSVLDSLLMDMTRPGEPGEVSPEFEKDILASAVAIGRKYRFDEAHSLHVEKLATMLFDDLESFCGMKKRYRLMLRVAAVLHDIGVFISSRSHHKHSAYLVTNSEILGVTPEEQAVIAHVCRYHRRATPRIQHLDFWALPQSSRVAVSKIAAILRVADALDRNHNQEIVSVRAVPGENEVVLEVESRGDMLVDQWALESKADLFREVFGVPVSLARTS
jgi:exopolyphosphatase/guanosine-5'-triphosphate,3'-diphosphate pyrophosphatase